MSGKAPTPQGNEAPTKLAPEQNIGDALLALALRSERASRESEARHRIESACRNIEFAEGITLELHVESVMALLYSSGAVCYTAPVHLPHGGHVDRDSDRGGRDPAIWEAAGVHGGVEGVPLS